MLLDIFEEYNEEVLSREKTEFALDFHRRIIGCIRQADAKGARRLMSKHLTDVHQRILQETERSAANEAALHALSENRNE